MCAAYDSSASVFYEQGVFHTKSCWEYPYSPNPPLELVGGI